MPNETIQAVDRLAHAIIKNLHKLFGFSYSRNTEHFTYQISFDSAVDPIVGAISTGSLRITQEADFVCTRVNLETRWLVCSADAGAVGKLFVNDALADPAANGEAVQDVPFDIAIIDGSTDRQLQNTPCSARAAYGMTGGLPGIWTKPRMFARNSNITIQLTALRTMIVNNDSVRTRVLFMGYKIYDASSLDLTSRRP